VRWVTADAHENPITRRDLATGVYPDPREIGFAIPLQADPYAEDLVRGYWQSLRAHIKGLVGLRACPQVVHAGEHEVS
jgi:hypothetical protein